MERRYLLIILAAIVGLSCSPLYAGAPSSPLSPDDVERLIVKLINDERQALNLRPFVLDDQLAWMAQVRSDECSALVLAAGRSCNPLDGKAQLRNLINIPHQR